MADVGTAGGWHLPNAGDADRRIREGLLAGEDHDSIAERVGCATGYVQAVARELASTPPPHAPGAPRADY